MDPVSALGLASNVIQIVDFSSRIIARGQELHTSVDGRTEGHAALDNATTKLSELHNSLRSFTAPSSRDMTVADKQLIRLTEESEDLAQRLRVALNQAKLEPGHGKFHSIYHALKSVWSEKEISNLAIRLDSIRKQVDSALLVSLREEVGNRTKGTTSGSYNFTDLDRDEARQRHADLLGAIRAKGWQANRPADVNAFSQQMRSYAAEDLKRQWHRLILARLYFRHMPDRAENISDAHSRTYEWLFSRKGRANTTASWDSFTDWLQQEDTCSSIYWITGKPGSGKSTLMKFINFHPLLTVHLKEWTKGEHLTKAGFYFWNSGSVMQKSRLGLFQTLIHTCLKKLEDKIIPAFPERWEQFNAFGGGQEVFEWPELRRAFKHIISDKSRKFFFLIDGLDEFDGQPKEIIDLILDCAQTNVKLCIASRPWLPFEDAFNTRPNLLLQQLTRPDISLYVSDHFQRNEHYIRAKDSDPIGASALFLDIAEKASGVFLWVYLVVQSLIEGLSNSDRMTDLQARLDALPSDLEALFDKLLVHLQPEYFIRACETFRLLRSFRKTHEDSETIGRYVEPDPAPTLLELYFADDSDTKSSLEAPSEPLRIEEARQRAEHMRRRLNARCKGFIEVQERTQMDPYEYPASYLHRTARDFVESDGYWSKVLQATGHDSYDAEERWANANLWLLKTHPRIGDGPYYLRRFAVECTEGAVIILKKTSIMQKTYLDELSRTHIKYSSTDPAIPKEDLTPITFAVQLAHTSPALLGYLAVVLEFSTSAERRQALKGNISRYGNTHNLGLVEGSAKKREFNQMVKYYTATPATRWLYRRPLLPRCE